MDEKKKLVRQQAKPATTPTVDQINEDITSTQGRMW
jgi:hypothetical protein